MSLRLTFFLFLSLSIHILVFIFSYQFSQPFFVQPVYIEVMDDEAEVQQKLFLVDQPQFNQKTPKEDYYLSKHDNYTLKEQKGKLESGLNFSYEPLEMSEGETSLLFQASPSLFGNIDYLKDVETEGIFNILNTKRVLFYTFYSRIKRQIYWHWEKALLNEFELTQFPIEKQFMTRVEALFNSKGYLYSIIIRKKSGLDELDRASIRAIQRAQPFLNPPEKLISDTGSFKLNYTFVLNESEASPY